MKIRRQPPRRQPRLDSLEYRYPPGYALGGVIGFALLSILPAEAGQETSGPARFDGKGAAFDPPQALRIEGPAPAEEPEADPIAGSLTTMAPAPDEAWSPFDAVAIPAGNDVAIPTTWDFALADLGKDQPIPGNQIAIAPPTASPESSSAGNTSFGSPAFPNMVAFAAAGVGPGGAAEAPPSDAPFDAEAEARAIVMASNGYLPGMDIDVDLTPPAARAQAKGASPLASSAAGVDTAGTRTFSVSAPDPGTPGALATTREEYEFGYSAYAIPGFPTATATAPLELDGSVTYPTDLSGGPRPLIMLLHGRHSYAYNPATGATVGTWPPPEGSLSIPSFRGYDYLSDVLASQGYIVVSIGANGINARDAGSADAGMTARGQLVLKHLEIWDEFSTGTGSSSYGAPFGDKFVGKVDMQNVGLMGHSRGGEGVVTAFNQNKSLGSPYGINAIFALAPVNFLRYTNNDVPFAVLLPYADGDVSDLQGIKFFDDQRYNVAGDPTAKYSMLAMGANHNFFNTIWTPGLFPPAGVGPGLAGASDDWGTTGVRGSDPFASTVIPGNLRLTPAQQQGVGIAYMGGFFRTYLGGETEFLPILKGDALPPASAQGAKMYLSYQAPDTPEYRLDLNRLTSKATLDTNTLGGSVIMAGLSPYDIVGGSLAQRHVLPNQPRGREPSTTISSQAGNVLGLSQLVVGWDDPTATYVNTIPAGAGDVSDFAAFQFRVGLNFADYRNVYTTQDFSIVLSDGSGNSATTAVSPYTDWLFYPPGKVSPLPKLILSTVRIPLAAFVGVDLDDVRSVQFKMDLRPTGALVFADLAFADPAGTFTTSTAA